MDNDYGQATMDGFLEAAPKYGIKVINKYSYSLNDRQFGSIVASVKRDNPDGSLRDRLFLHWRPFGRATARGRHHRRRSSARRLSTRTNSSRSRARRPKALISSTASIATATMPRCRQFFAEFSKRAGYPPENVAAITYSAVKLMADAIKRANSADPAKVRDALAATKNFPTTRPAT